MVPQTPWLERTFQFGLPVGQFPNLLTRLYGTPARLTVFFGNIPREILTRKEGDAWSIQEHIGHLLDLEKLFHGRLQDYREDRENLKPADMSNAATRSADHNRASIRDLMLQFNEARSRFVEELESFSEEELEITRYHERLGVDMRIIDNAWFCAEHDDHHIATMFGLRMTYMDE